MTRSHVRGALVITGAFLTLCLAGVFVATLCWGEVGGTEFSPDRFAHRSFRYRAIPLLEIRVTPRRHREYRTPLEEYLHGHGLVPEADRSEARWLLVKGFRAGVRGWHGSAKRMCNALDCWSGKSEQWVTWSEAHPELAEVLWPTVVSSARTERFSEACRAVRLAEHADSAEGLRTKFDEFGLGLSQ